MKKTLTAALAAAFVMGIGSPTFANPFSDVPRGHWAYQSIEKLAAANVIEGYGDGTYRGDRNITRYEMAQMIAKAMARLEARSGGGEGLSDSGDYRALKLELDRLAAEFREELDSLGVRVSELEKYSDKVVWNGELRYRYIRDKEDVKGGGDIKRSNNPLQLRLLPTAEVNDHWKIKARMTATAKMQDDTAGNFALTFAYAEGTYDKLQLKVGKMPLYTNVDDGLLMDDFFSGAQITYGDKFKVLLSAGRWSNFDDPASYQAGELSYDNDKLYIGAGYHHLRSDDFRTYSGYKDSKDANIWTVGAGYNFGENVRVAGSYAQNTKADEYDKSWNAGISYKGANKKQPGSWGISADYRYVSDNVSFAPTYDTYILSSNKKGVDIGVDWAPIMNTQVYFNYFWGNTLDTKQDTKTFFARASWFF